MATNNHIERSYRLAPMQQGMLFHCLSAPDDGMYIVQTVCEMPPGLDVAAFKKAWQSVIDRHGVLRSAFLWVGVSEPKQSVCDDVSVEIDHEDWTGVPVAQHDDLLKAYLLSDKKRGFDLSTPPLMRFALLKVASDRWLFVWTFHHLLLDGRSRTKLMKEVSLFYEAYCSNQNLELPSPPAYADYIDWFYRQDRSGAEAYWRKLLGTFSTPVKIDLPGEADKGSPEDRYQTVQLAVSTEIKDSLQRLAWSHKVTVNLIVQALWAVLLARYGDQEDVVFGETRACRHPNFENATSVIGLLINTVPIRLQVSGSKLFLELLQELRSQRVEVRPYESTPLTYIRDASSIDRTVKLFHSLVVFEEYYPGAALQRDGCALWQGNLSRFCSINYPLTLVGYLKPDLLLQIDYDRWSYGETEMKRLAGHLTRLFEEVIRDPSLRIADLRFLTDAENQELTQWNRTESDYPHDSCLHQLFEEQVEQRPEAVAVMFEDEALSYGELNRRANQLGHYLRELGVGPDARVAICVDRSLEMIVGLLGVLKAGGAYVPLDPAYPQERLQYMLADSGPVVVLTQAHLQGLFAADNSELPVLELDAAAPLWSNHPETNLLPRAIGLTSQHLAYVIYTSGSTGTPKGVALQHRSLINLVCWHCADFDLQPGMRSSCVAGFGFDAATWEIWPALCAGATVMLPLPMVARDPEALLAWWSERGPEISFLPTPVAEMVFAQGVSNPQQRTLLVGGDHLRRLPAQALPYSLINNYGPTEATVVATSGKVELPAATATIGRPIANTQLYILDQQGEPVPVGVPGELYIGGEGLARCYLNRSDLTAERFVSDPFAFEPGARMYRTGDLVRWLRDGRVEFLGRVDHQVKVRGYRIELGEIEARLVEHEAVREAVVLARAEETGGDKRLVAYYTSVAGKPGAEELRQHLSTRLPEYMVPAAYVQLEQLPLTLNGKLDRKALPAPAGEAYAVRGYEEPVGEIETALARIWAELLKLEQVGRYDKFFDLGGHSLLAMRVTSQLRQALGVEMAVSDLFAHPVLADFARLIESAAQATLPPITPCERRDALPLSFAQQRLWLLAQMGASHAYHIFYGWRLQGQLDRVALRKALDSIVARHEALRTTFISVAGEPQQHIAAAGDSFFQLLEHDLSEQPNSAEALAGLIQEEAEGTFDLAVGPLIRGRLVRLSETEHALLLTLHHIVSDGWSESILLKELSVLYAAFRSGESDPLPALAVQYADYAVWQRQWLAGEALQLQTEYWQRQLAGAPALLELPADHARPAEQDYTGGSVQVGLSAELTQQLKQLSKQHGVTLYMTLLAGWAALLGRLAGQTDVVIGTPVANRSRAEVEDLIGFFVNTLALRVDLSGAPTGGELLERVKAQAVAAQQHQEMPFEQVVEAVQPLRSLSQGPLFQVMFAWQNAPAGELKLSELEAQSLPGGLAVAKFDLTLTLREAGDGIVGRLEYARSLYEAETIERYVGFYRRLLEGIVADESRRVDTLAVLGEAEREQVLVTWNATAAEYERERCVHELIEAQAQQRPEAVAVVCEDQVLSYGELNRRANQLGHYLRARGVGPDTRVAICVERSLEMIIGLVGVLKAGGAYVPLDPEYPIERLAFMLAESNADILLTDEKLKEALPSSSAHVIYLKAEQDKISNYSKANLANLSSPDNLAYVMFTSGSTGKPKGIAVTHRNVVRLVRQNDYAHFAAEERFLQFAPISFDASTFEVWGSLLNGACLVVFPARQAALEDLGQVVREQNVTVLWLTAGLFHQMVESGPLDELKQLRQLLAGGDALSAPHVRRAAQALPGCRLTNGYGPTEGTTFTCCYSVEAADAVPDNVPIGRPIGNTQVYVLDQQGEPVPVGVPGELYIGGDGLARGYMSQPGLTAERFIPGPFAFESGARMYRTGDLVRWLRDGRVEFLGRVDHQVKVRGYRIELGEIEARLLEHEAVREAVVLARAEETGGDKRLVAYYTSVAGKPGAEELRQHLSTRLPEYMVPAAYVQLEQLPLTLNGKLDRKALPAPAGEAYAVRGYEEPVGEIETALARIWAELLKLEQVGRYDKFFDLGGHSLLAMRVTSQLRQALGVEMAVSDLFAHPVLADFARLIESAAQATLPPITPCERRDALPLSFAQQRLWLLAQMGASHAYHIFYGWRLQGQLDRVALRKALDSIVARHEALRTTFISVAGEPQQHIAAAGDSFFQLLEHDLSEQPNSAEALAGLIQEEAEGTFDLAVGPLIRGRLVRLSETEHALLLTLHHIVSDGWSESILLKELSVLYAAFRSGESDPLPALAVQYADYAVWQRQWLAGEALQLQTEYWQRQLAGAPALLELPADHARPAEQDYTGGSVQVGLSAELTQQLKQLSKQHGVTLYMTLLAGWAALLGRLAGQTDVVIGTPVANRSRAEVEDLIGFFVNTLALRVDLSGAPTGGELLERVKAQAVAAQQHQEMPFEQVVEAVQPLRSLSQGPLFQVMFAWQNAPAGELKLSELEAQSLPGGLAVAKFDLTLTLREAGDGIVGRLEYARSLYEAETIERYVGFYRRLLEGIVADESRRVDTLAVLGEAEREQVLVTWNATAAEYERERCVHELIEAQAQQRPEAVAVVCEDQVLSYGELNRRANQLGHYLRARGVGPDTRVAICVERSLEMIIGLVGVLKAGGAYVPLDPAYPQERLQYMLADSAPVVLLTQTHLRSLCSEISGRLPVLELNAPAPPWSNHPETNPLPATVGLTSQHLAYVIYTSGSTGTPKAVALQHRGLVNLVYWQFTAFDMKPGVRASCVAGFGFDAVTWELWPALCGGATVMLPLSMVARDPEALLAWWSERGPEISFLPTAVAELAFTQGVNNPQQRLLLVGGDHLRRLPAQALSYSLINNYGPAETTVCATSGKVELPATTATIGTPIANTQIYILDQQGEPAPIGVPGELYIGGEALARGYLNRGDLTAQRFVSDPFAFEPGARMYRTGDLARWLADGRVEFLGRVDHQVKVRGYRIELGEIEARLVEHEMVREAVVLAREEEAGGDKRLVAYYTSVTGKIGAAELRQHLAAWLPEHMVPAAYVYLDQLPLTLNGKLDRKALPAPDGEAYAVRDYEEPVGETETAIAEIWMDVLKLERVGRHDNFFELGGHSLLAARVVNRLRTMLSIEFSVRTLFEGPTVFEIAEHVKQAAPATMPLRPSITSATFNSYTTLSVQEV